MNELAESIRSLSAAAWAFVVVYAIVQVGRFVFKE